MGNTKSSALSREILEDIKLNTKFSEDELTEWYSSFMRDCPDGRISRERFEKIYARFFPNADPKVYAQHVFRSFDKNSDGTLDFKEYIIALHLTSSGKTQLKLEWAFSLYDVDGNGTINKSEILEIVKEGPMSSSISWASCDDTGGPWILDYQNGSISAIFKMIPPEEVHLLKDDENTPDKRADKIWKHFGKTDKDKLTEGEFVQGLKDKDEIMRLIQYEPPKK